MLPRVWATGAERWRPTTGSLLFLLTLIGASVISYTTIVLPQHEALMCGPTFADDPRAWIDAGSNPTEQPDCTALVPSQLARLYDFLPWAIFAALAFLAITKRGSITATPAAATLFAMWLALSTTQTVVVGLSRSGRSYGPATGTGRLYSG